MKRTGRLRARSKKRAALYVTRRALVADLHAAHPICEVPSCTRPSTDPHEPLTRARGGSITDPTNVRMVCRPCHDEITNEAPWAYTLGFLKHSWDRKDIA